MLTGFNSKDYTCMPNCFFFLFKKSYCISKFVIGTSISLYPLIPYPPIPVFPDFYNIVFLYSHPLNPYPYKSILTSHACKFLDFFYLSIPSSSNQYPRTPVFINEIEAG